MESPNKIESGVRNIVDMYMDQFKKNHHSTLTTTYTELLQQDNRYGLTEKEVDILAKSLGCDVTHLDDHLKELTSVTVEQIFDLMMDLQNKCYSSVVQPAKMQKSNMSLHSYGVLVKGRIVHTDKFYRNLADSKTYRLPYLKDKCMNEECSICGEEFEEKAVVCTVKCKHTFHPTCIDRWYMESSTCPYCRSDIVISPLIDYLYETNVKKNGDVIAKINLTTM